MLLREEAGLTDGQLLEDFISRRDEAALATVVQRHGPMVWGVCRRVLHNHHDAEDAFQATFLVLVRRAASIASKELLANWLYGVAHQTALKASSVAAKRKGRERQVVEMPESAVEAQDLWSDLEPVLEEELSRLPDKYRVPIILCDLEGKTRREAARQLGVPEGTVAGRLARARTMLAKRLTQRGIALSGGALATVLAQNVASAVVPPSVVSSTIKVATLFAAKEAVSGVISANIASLTEGVLKSMLLKKLKTVTVILLGLAVIGSGIGFSYHRLQAADPATAQKTPAPADKKADGQVALKTARFSAAKKAYEAIWGEYQVGMYDEEIVYRWSLRLLESQRSSAQTPGDRIKAFEAHLDRMKKLQELAPKRDVIVPVERIDQDGKPGLGIGITKEGKRSGLVARFGTRPALAAETTAFFKAEAECWLAEAKIGKPSDR